MFLNVRFDDVVRGARIEGEDVHVHVEGFVEREEVLDVDVGHAVVVAEGRFVDVAEDGPGLESLRMRDVALLVEEDAAFLAVGVLEADADAGGSVGVAALREGFGLVADRHFESDFAVENVEEGFFMFERRIGIFRMRRRTERADQLNETGAHLRGAEDRHLGVDDPGDRVDDAPFGRDDREAVALDDGTVGQEVLRISGHDAS